MQWLQVGYPDGVPAPDRIALLELLRSTPLSEDEIEDAVDAVDDPVEDEADERDVIAEFIADMANCSSDPDSVARVAAKLAAAGWPLVGIERFVHADEAPNAEAASHS